MIIFNVYLQNNIKKVHFKLTEAVTTVILKLVNLVTKISRRVIMKIITQADIKIRNKNNLIKLITENPEISRTELSVKSGLSGGTITALSKELIAENLIEESKTYMLTGGRPKIGLRIKKNECYSLVVEVKQRDLVIKHFDVHNNLLSEKIYQTNYLNGNYIVDTILKHLENIEVSIKKIGLFLEENIDIKEISYLFSTGLSDDQIPIEDAIRMFVDAEVVIDYSLKYYLDVMVTDSILENVELYANIDINKSLTTTIYSRNKQLRLKNAMPLSINLQDIFDKLGYKHFWDNLSNENLLIEKDSGNSSYGSKSFKNYYNKIIQMLTDAIMTLQIFYPLDAIFLIDIDNKHQGLEEVLWDSVKKQSKNKLKLIKIIVPDKNNVAINMNRSMQQNI